MENFPEMGTYQEFVDRCWRESLESRPPEFWHDLIVLLGAEIEPTPAQVEEIYRKYNLTK